MSTITDCTNIYYGLLETTALELQVKEKYLVVYTKLKRLGGWDLFDHSRLHI